jgi:RNA polymerase-binding transcription factor DksA
MATKKKAAPKKSAKPAKKAAKKKPAAKKTAAKKPMKKTVPKKAARPAAKKTAIKKPLAGSASHKIAGKHTPAPKVVAKPVVKPTGTSGSKPGAFDPRSLVTIKPKVRPIIKKEPPKPVKMIIPKMTTKSSVKYEPEFTKSVLDTPFQDQNGPTQRYSDGDLSEFKEIILKKLDAAKKELAYLQGLITRKDEGGDMDEARYMTMEDGSVSMEREQLSQMASRQITFIDHLEKALMRIENKTYGICRVTGKLIDKARLRAVPHATLSIEAKQMMNK